MAVLTSVHIAQDPFSLFFLNQLPLFFQPSLSLRDDLPRHHSASKVGFLILKN